MRLQTISSSSSCVLSVADLPLPNLTPAALPPLGSCIPRLSAALVPACLALCRVTSSACGTWQGRQLGRCCQEGAMPGSTIFLPAASREGTAVLCHIPSCPSCTCPAPAALSGPAELSCHTSGCCGTSTNSTAQAPRPWNRKATADAFGSAWAGASPPAAAEGVSVGWFGHA